MIRMCFFDSIGWCVSYLHISFPHIFGVLLLARVHQETYRTIHLKAPRMVFLHVCSAVDVRCGELFARDSCYAHSRLLLRDPGKIFFRSFLHVFFSRQLLRTPEAV